MRIAPVAVSGRFRPSLRPRTLRPASWFDTGTARRRSGRNPLGRLALAEPPEGAPRPRPERATRPGRHQDRYLDRADRLRRTFGLEILICAHWGGRWRVLVLITSRRVAKPIFDRLDLPSDPPPIAPARPPPDSDIPV